MHRFLDVLLPRQSGDFSLDVFPQIEKDSLARCVVVFQHGAPIVEVLEERTLIDASIENTQDFDTLVVPFPPWFAGLARIAVF